MGRCGGGNRPGRRRQEYDGDGWRRLGTDGEVAKKHDIVMVCWTAQQLYIKFLVILLGACGGRSCL